MTATPPRRWTNVYVQFSLPVDDQRRLDAALVARGTSIGQEFHRALRASLRECGVDPDHLDRPEADVDDHHDAA